MDKKIAVIYKSKYGATKRYAGWIALRLDADLYEVSDILPRDLKKYNVIIYGGPLYAGKIKGIDFITNNFDKLSNKKIIIFSVGFSSESEEYKLKILEDNFDEEIIDKINLFHFRGAFNYKELSFMDKMMMKFMKKNLESKARNDLTDDDMQLLKAFDKEVDLTDKKSINKLIEVI